MKFKDLEIGDELKFRHGKFLKIPDLEWFGSKYNAVVLSVNYDLYKKGEFIFFSDVAEVEKT